MISALASVVLVSRQQCTCQDAWSTSGAAGSHLQLVIRSPQRSLCGNAEPDLAKPSVLTAQLRRAGYTEPPAAVGMVLVLCGFQFMDVSCLKNPGCLRDHEAEVWIRCPSVDVIESCESWQHAANICEALRISPHIASLIRRRLEATPPTRTPIYAAFLRPGTEGGRPAADECRSPASAVGESSRGRSSPRSKSSRPTASACWAAMRNT